METSMKYFLSVVVAVFICTPGAFAFGFESIQITTVNSGSIHSETRADAEGGDISVSVQTTNVVGGGEGEIESTVEVETNGEKYIKKIKEHVYEGEKAVVRFATSSAQYEIMTAAEISEEVPEVLQGAPRSLFERIFGSAGSDDDLEESEANSTSAESNGIWQLIKSIVGALLPL